MRPLILTILFILILLAEVDRAAAFICTLSPDKSTVIVKVSNPYAQQTACTVTCNFITPDGIKSVTCTQTVRAAQRIGTCASVRPPANPTPCRCG